MKNNAYDRLINILNHNIKLKSKDRDTINQIYATLISEGHLVFFKELVNSIRSFECKYNLGNVFKYRACDFFLKFLRTK